MATQFSAGHVIENAVMNLETSLDWLRAMQRRATAIRDNAAEHGISKQNAWTGSPYAARMDQIALLAAECMDELHAEIAATHKAIDAIKPMLEKKRRGESHDPA